VIGENRRNKARIRAPALATKFSPAMPAFRQTGGLGMVAL